MRIGFILTTYNRIDDFLAHLDIIKYFPMNHSVIPIWMNRDMPDYFLSEMKNYEHAHYCNGIKFSIGPLLGLISGLKKAAELDLDFVIYRNGDDWLFNNDFVLQNLEVMKNYDASAYNWFTMKTNREFAMNELCLRVEPFMKNIDYMYDYFLSSNDKLFCEFKMAKWINRTTQRFYRLPHREEDYGIGNGHEYLSIILKYQNIDPGQSFWDNYKINNRYFNSRWQLIGSHDNKNRFDLYQSIRNKIPYRNSLEKEPHFSRWLEMKEWNIETSETERIPISDVKIKRTPKMLLRRTKD